MSASPWMLVAWERDGVTTVQIVATVPRNGAPLRLLVTRSKGNGREGYSVTVEGGNGSRWAGKFTLVEAAMVESMLDACVALPAVPS